MSECASSFPVATPYGAVEIYDVSLAGFGGDPIQAWLTWAQVGDEPQPAVVEFVGYGGGRDLPGTYLHWASVGYIHLLVDIRGRAPAGVAAGPPATRKARVQAPQGSWRGASSTPSPITIGAY